MTPWFLGRHSTNEQHQPGPLRPCPFPGHTPPDSPFYWRTSLSPEAFLLGLKLRAIHQGLEESFLTGAGPGCVGAFPQRGDGETVGRRGFFSVRKGGMPHPGTGSHQGIGLETERCIFSWDGPGGLTWEGDGPVITSQMPEKKSLQQPESCSFTGGWQAPPPPLPSPLPPPSPPPPASSSWWPRGVCLPLFLSRHSPSLGAEFGLRAVGRKGSDRGTESWDGDGDQAQSPGRVASARSSGSLGCSGAGGSQSLWAPRTSADF